MPIYQALINGQLTKLTGLWLIYGDEPLVWQWFIDKVRPIFKHNHQTIERIYLNSPKDWVEVITALDSLSLFGDDTALIVQNKQKIDKILLDKLTQFGKEAKQGNNANCLIYQLPKPDKKEQNSPLFKLFLTHGTVIDAHIYNEKTRQELLVQKAQEFQLTLDKQAWQFLLEHTENHLLSAYQALWRLSDLYPNHPMLTHKELMQALVSDYQYSVFHLADSLLAGDSYKAAQILSHLQHTETAPSLVLWAIAKEARLLLQLQSGKTASELGIWQSKAPLYHQAAKRPLNPAILLAIYHADQSIKGVKENNIWRQLQALCLHLCQPHLFTVYTSNHPTISRTTISPTINHATHAPPTNKL